MLSLSRTLRYFLVLPNLLMLKTSMGTDASWCTTKPNNYSGATVYSISGVSSSVSNVVTRRIQSLVCRDLHKGATVEF